MPTPARPIAVIGLACRYPGAPDAKALWENILFRRRQFRRIPDCRLPLADYHDPDPKAEDLTYGKRAAVIDGWSFDPAANRVPRSAFEATDIVHWLTLDIARQAVSDAGLDLDTMNRDRVGMVLGNTLTGEETRSNTLRLRWPFLRRALRHAATECGLDDEQEGRLEEALKLTWRSAFPKINEDSLAGGLANTIAGRVCNVLDLHGGGYVVDGACASSLLAVATAAELLESGQLDIALAGGVDVSLDPFELVGFAKATALSVDEMAVYDRRGRGFIPGEGCGVVVLQPLDRARAEGRRVLAVLRGWGVSSDGRGGITAPSVAGQALALGRAYERADYSPHTLDFVEGHGTGTAVGDRVELEGISRALERFGAPTSRAVGVTSFKSIVGHTKAAAGIGGFIKAVLAVNQRVVPATAGCVEPHAVFGGAASALYPVLRNEARAADAVLRAGVSAMGFGGINSHVTLESGDAPSERYAVDPATLHAPWTAELLPLGAADLAGLRAAVAALRADAEGISVAELGDLAVHTSAALAQGAPWRAAVVATTVEGLCEALDTLATRLEAAARSGHTEGPGFSGPRPTPRVGLLFPGQGSQAIGMAGALVERYPWARARLEEADRAASAFDAFVSEPLSAFVLRPTWRDPAQAALEAWTVALTDTRVAQPAIALASALWWEHLTRLGVRADVVAGHSLGELVALFASGAYDLTTLVRLAALRGQAMAAPAERPGGMAALLAGLDVTQSLLVGTLVVPANLNAPDQTVVSGPADEVQAVLEAAAARGIQGRALRVSNAFHSPLVAAAATTLRAHDGVPRAALARTAVPLSGVDGAPVPEDADLRERIAAAITLPVDFVRLAHGVSARAELLLEVGPGQVLSRLGERCGLAVAVSPMEAKPGRDEAAAEALARLHVAGVPLHWERLYAGRFVRPFVPARERQFYRNPCERPFPELDLDALPRLPASLRGASSGGAAERLVQLLDHLRATLRASHAAVFVADAHGRSVLAASPPRPEALQPGARGLAIRALEDGDGWSARLLVAEPGYSAEVDGWPGAVLRGAIARVVELDGDRAALMLARTDDDPFGEADARVLETLARAARTLIARALNEGRDRRAAGLEARVQGWAEDIARDEPVSALIRAWIEGAAESLNTEAASLFLHDPADATLFSVAAWRRGAEGHQRLRFDAARGLAGHVWRTGRAVHLDDAYTDERFNPEVDLMTGFRTRSIDCLPLLAEDGRVLGVVQLLNRAGAAWGEAEHRRLQQLTASLAALVSLHRLVEGVRASSPAPERAAPAQPAEGPRAVLWQMIQDRTGFSGDSLHGGLRLLDDLNLDSIKAGALLAELGAALGLAPGTFEGLATATLDDVLARAAPAGGPVDGRARLYALVQERTGFDVASLRDDLRLLDDLNLDSIKAGALLADLARALGRDAAPEGLANATLGEVLERLTASAPPSGTPTSPERRWVADFVVAWADAPAAAAEPPERLAVLGEGPLADALLGGVTSGQGLDDELSALEQPPKNLVILMPEGPPDLDADVLRLTALARVHERFGHAGLSRVLLVQRGDGRFGQRDSSAGHLGVRAFAASLAQDRADLVVRAVDLHAALPPSQALSALWAELGAAESGAAGVDADGVRAIPTLRRVDGADAVGAGALPTDGVALVTGGGKGITAECALALGGLTGLPMVLVGSAPAGDEVRATLTRMAAAGLTATYRRCDVADADAVRALVASVRAEIGPITAVLHGAGLNRPRPTLTVDRASARAEIAPKLDGAAHLMSALEDAPPALFVALTSVIGVLGMAGNAWYAFANEGLDLSLRRFAARHPGTRALSMAYSVWDEVGMGVKLGSVDALARRGISAIPVEEGVARLRRWLSRQAPDTQVVTTGRMGALTSAPPPLTGRFLGEVQTRTPGVEHVTRLHLHPDLDRYVRHHDFRGSLLFPTVMGLEAMGQAALAALGRAGFGDLVIEDVRLERPIVVHPTRGEPIEVRAWVLDREDGAAPLKVMASIHTASSGFGPAHFEATFVLDSPMPEAPPPEVGAPLDLIPAEDLYGGMLFQGPDFQRLCRVFALDAQSVVFETEARATTLAAPEGFSDTSRAPLVVGDPYHRDTLLQAAQLVVTPEIALPVGIKRIELGRPGARASGPGLATCRFLGREGDTLRMDVAAWDAEGRLVERLSGYTLRVLERDAALPDVAGLMNPEARDQAEIQRRLDAAAAVAGLQAPRVVLAHHRDVERLGRVERRRITGPVLAQAARAAGADAEVIWEDSGRPVLAGRGDIGLSLSHDATSMLAVAGAGPQGCDLVGRDTRPAETWRGMLPRNAALLDARATPDGLDLAGRALWAAQEAAMKALGSLGATLSLLDATPGGPWRLVARDGQAEVIVLVITARLARGGDRVIAAVARNPATNAAAAPTSNTVVVAPVAPPQDEGWGDLAAEGVRVETSEAEGRRRILQRGMVSFREASEPSGAMRHTQYFRKMGELRELAARPVLGAWVKDFLSGRWGAVTNSTRLVVLDVVGTGEVIEGGVELVGLSGPMDSTMELRFTWDAVTDDGGRRPVAQGVMETTWVEITGHGEARVAPNPAYLGEFARRMRARGPVAPRPTADRSAMGALLGRPGLRPGQAPLHRAAFTTSREHSNIVGNIYFAHYPTWQGEAVDGLIAALHPPYAAGRTGELRVSHVAMEHFREAMPYDVIEAHLHVSEVRERGVSLRAELLRRGPTGLIKLAAGVLEGVWYAPGHAGWAPAPLPAGLAAGLLQTPSPTRST